MMSAAYIEQMNEEAAAEAAISLISLYASVVVILLHISSSSVVGY